MTSLFDVDIESRDVDVELLDTDSEEVYLDPDFRRLLELRDEDIISSVRDRLNNRSSLVIGRLPAMLFLLNTPASCRVLVRADFISIRNLLFSSWRLSSSWDPSDEHFSRVVASELFRTLMFLDNEVLVQNVEDVGVDPRRVSKFAAILLIVNTTSSWVLLGSADDNSIIAVAHSEYATERRINTLRQELDRLGRSTSLLKDTGEESISHLPIELVRNIVLNTHDIARLSELQKISYVYAKVLDEPEVLQQLVNWWKDNGEQRVSSFLYDSPVRDFREFRKWVINNFRTTLCYESDYHVHDCFNKMIVNSDVETWENIKMNMDPIDIIDVLDQDPWLLVENNSREIGQYVIDHAMAVDIDNTDVLLVSAIAFGTANDVRRTIDRLGTASDLNLAYAPYYYLLIRSDYNRDITRMLLDELARTPEHIGRGITVMTNYVLEGPTSSRWIPELIEDLENGYYPFYPDLPSIQTHENSQTYTNYWLIDGSSWQPNDITLADYLRDLMWGRRRTSLEADVKRNNNSRR